MEILTIIRPREISLTATNIDSKVNQLTDNMSKLTDAVASLAQIVNSKNN